MDLGSALMDSSVLATSRLALNAADFGISPLLGLSEEQASLSHISFHSGRFFVVVSILFCLQVGLLYAAESFKNLFVTDGRKVMHSPVGNRCMDGDDLKSYGLRKTFLLLLAILAATITYQSGLSPPGGFWKETQRSHSRCHGRNKQGLRHMAWILAQTGLTLVSSHRFIVTLPLQMMHFAFTLHQHVQWNLKFVTCMVRLVFRSRFKAFGIPPMAKAAGALRDSESTSMGWYRENEPENSRVANHGVINGAATWLVASADRHHMTGNRSLISDFKTEEDDLHIQACNGTLMPVTGRGTVITDTMVLPDVWFVPGLTENIVSVSQLIELDCNIVFTRDACYIRDATGDTMIGKAPAGENGMFKLDFLKVPIAD